MTHKEAIEYLEKADVTVYQEPKTKTAEALEMAIKALEDSRWIPATERLPDEEGYYLVTAIDGYSYTGGIRVEYWWGKNLYWSTAFDVTAWMPLPKPYEEGADR